MLERVRQGKVVRCKECDALVKVCYALLFEAVFDWTWLTVWQPDIVFFGEGLPDRFFKLMRTVRACLVE